MFDFLGRNKKKERDEKQAASKKELSREEYAREYNKREWRSNDFRVHVLKDGIWVYLSYDLVFVSEIDLVEKIVTLSGIMPKCDRVLNSVHLSGNTISISRGICIDPFIYNENDVIFSLSGCRIIGQKIIFPKSREKFDYVTRDVQITYLNNP